VQRIIQNARAVCELSGGIPTADFAAAIKFGVEAVPGVKEVHFIGEDVEVVCDEQGVSVESILSAFERNGCSSGSVALKT
jgi:hypothetical protein